MFLWGGNSFPAGEKPWPLPSPSLNTLLPTKATPSWFINSPEPLPAVTVYVDFLVGSWQWEFGVEEHHLKKKKEFLFPLFLVPKFTGEFQSDCRGHGWEMQDPPDGPGTGDHELSGAEPGLLQIHWLVCLHLDGFQIIPSTLL